MPAITRPPPSAKSHLTLPQKFTDGLCQRRTGLGSAIGAVLLIDFMPTADEPVQLVEVEVLDRRAQKGLQLSGGGVPAPASTAIAW